MLTSQHAYYTSIKSFFLEYDSITDFPCCGKLSRNISDVRHNMYHLYSTRWNNFPPTLSSLLTDSAGEGIGLVSACIALGRVFLVLLSARIRPVHPGEPEGRDHCAFSFLCTPPCPQCPADQRVPRRMQCRLQRTPHFSAQSSNKFWGLSSEGAFIMCPQSPLSTPHTPSAVPISQRSWEVPPERALLGRDQLAPGLAGLHHHIIPLVFPAEAPCCDYHFP